MPPAAKARCFYAVDWVSTKPRWGLSVDQAEAQTLGRLSDECGEAEIKFEKA